MLISVWMRLPGAAAAGLALLGCMGLAACSATPTPAPTVRAAKPGGPVQPAQAGPDGVYQGTSTRFQADRRDCPHPGLVTLVVQGEQFEFKWDRYLRVEAQIAPDGSVHGVGPDVTLTGQLSGRMLSGDVTNGPCGLHFTTRREV